MRVLGGVWDQELLDQPDAHCVTYLHGHSVAGTNPALLRAIGAGAAVTAFDVDFNREVVRDSGRFFRTPQDVARTLAAVEADPEGTCRAGDRARVLAARYDWDAVADGYEELARRLAARDVPRRRPSGRRTPTDADLPVLPQPPVVPQSALATPASNRLPAGQQ